VDIYLLTFVYRLAAYDLATPMAIPRAAPAAVTPVVMQPIM